MSLDNYKAQFLEKLSEICKTPDGASQEPVDASLPKMFIASAILQIIILILRFVSFAEYNVSVEVFGLSADNGGVYSINRLNGTTEEAVIVVLLMMLSAALCVLPIIQKNLAKHRRMILPKILAIWNAICIIFGMTALSDMVERNKYQLEHIGEDYSKCSWNLTFGGFFNILVTISMIILLFVISKKTKKYKK